MTAIRVLYFEGCPNHEPTLSLVRRVVADRGLDAQVELVEVKDAEDAARLRFLGSPTVQVNGVDIEPAAQARTEYAMSCRLYNTRDGLPSREILLAALDAADHGATGGRPVRSAAIVGVRCCESSEARGPQVALRPPPGISVGFVTVGGSLVAAMLSSACCWVPLLLVAFGASAAGVSAFFGPWRPFFMAAAVAMLALSFYLTFVRKPVAHCCSTGPAPRRRFGRATWWVSAVIVAAFVFFPQYVGLALGGSSQHPAPEASESQSPSREFTFRIEGMHCEACATSLTAILSKTEGVVRANVDYTTGTAWVWVNNEQVIGRVLDATHQAGFSTP